MKTRCLSLVHSPGRGGLFNRAVPLSLTCNSSSVLYSSLDAGPGDDNDPPADANTYRPFKVVNSVVTNNIQKELDLIGEMTEERVL
jgi:hypothetical protein